MPCARIDRNRPFSVRSPCWRASRTCASQSARATPPCVTTSRAAAAKHSVCRIISLGILHRYRSNANIIHNYINQLNPFFINTTAICLFHGPITTTARTASLTRCQWGVPLGTSLGSRATSAMLGASLTRHLSSIMSKSLQTPPGCRMGVVFWARVSIDAEDSQPEGHRGQGQRAAKPSSEQSNICMSTSRCSP